jgi:hypothetical protein
MADVDEREGLVEYSQFLGLRNNVSANNFERTDLVEATNVDIDDSLVLSRRKGYSAPVTAAIDRALWASGNVCLGVGANTLKQLLPDYSTRTLRTGLTPDRPLTYVAVGDRGYYANGVEKGCIRNGANHSWGLTVPPMPVATATGGTLPAGEYQYAVTYLRDDGQESGTGRAGTLNLPSAGGIALSMIDPSDDTDVTHKVVYLSPVGGEVLYRVGVIPNAETTFTVSEVRAGASPLRTQFLQPPPAGDQIAYRNGYMLVAKDTRLYPSEPYAPELFDYRKALPFLSRITMVAPVKGGVWVGMENQLGWLAGDVPEAWDYKVVADYGVVPGTLCFADAGLVGDGQASGEIIAMFASTRGLCAGLTGGRLLNMTETRFAYPIQPQGAGIVRRHRGIVQYLATMQGAETPGNAAV